jgi:calcineurin-like phosphoesterase family protein
MSNVFFISDLHFGHKNILKFSRQYREGNSIEEHDAWLMSNWNKVVNRKDVVYVLGDVAFDPISLKKVAELNGIKKLIRGNHDLLDANVYLKYFTNIYGLLKYKHFWLNHAPIRPNNLRGRIQIHGHVHEKTINDPRYINVCVEAINGTPISLEEIREIEKSRLWIISQLMNQNLVNQIGGNL